MTRLLISLLMTAVFWLPVVQADQPLVTFIGTNRFLAVNTEAAEAFGVKLVAYNLDGHRNLEKMLSKDLPQDWVKAERIANERLAAMDHRQLQAAFRGIALSIQWDIRKAPAFVFNDGSEVIYGLTDVEVALKRWQYHRMTR
jgi:integrating conjugative element protein (TIGR03757 family)